MAAFPCPACAGRTTRVTCTEVLGYSVKRYMRCTACEHRFRTLETTQEKSSKRRPSRHPRGRFCGERNGQAVLTSSNVTRIRQLAAEGISQRQLARQFGMAPSQINRIVRRQSWRHLP